MRAQNNTAMLLELSMSRGGLSWCTGLADPACEVLFSAAKTAVCPDRTLRSGSKTGVLVPTKNTQITLEFRKGRIAWAMSYNMLQC